MIPNSIEALFQTPQTRDSRNLGRKFDSQAQRAFGSPQNPSKGPISMQGKHSHSRSKAFSRWQTPIAPWDAPKKDQNLNHDCRPRTRSSISRGASDEHAADDDYHRSIACLSSLISRLCLLLCVFCFLPSLHAASLWSNSTTPATSAVSDGNPWEVGVKFTSDTAGYITGIRFYKGAGNTGTHVGHLWTSAGKLLASATFTNETASGWQQANFAQPVQVAAKTVYVASYWDPKGHYSVNSGYFTTAFNNTPLHAPVNNGSAGSNGLYIYGSDAFPNEGNLASNFWVDVVFSTTTTSTTTTSATTSTSAQAISLFSASATPAISDNADNSPYELGVKFTSDVSGVVTGVRFYKGAGNTGTHVGHLWTSTGTLLATATFTNETASGWQQVSFSQPVAITANTVYVASYWDPNGNYSLTRPFFASEYNNGPLHALADGTSGPNGVYAYGSSAFPANGYDSSNYWVDVVFVPNSSSLSLFSASATPATTDYADGSAYELGVRFTSDVAGTVTGIRFYKGTGNTGTHVGHLWTNTGTMLASATFTNETASGWQQVNFAQPVAISANTVYVASYTDPNGNYALNRPYFTSEYNNAPLHALADGVAGYSGTFSNIASGSTGAFPCCGYESSNYWVDVVFTPGSSTSTTSSNSSVTISSVSPASGPISGGTLVTINGSGFASGASVSFGGANASSVNFISSTQLTAVTPAGSAGSVNVSVTNSDPGTGTLNSGFSYVGNPTITTVSPNSGPATGGTTVTISGTGFQSGAIVAFGAMLATSVTVMSPTQIQAVTPAAAAGTVAVTVTNPDAGKATLTSGFSFASVGGSQPQITSATTDPGAAGSSASCVNQLPVGATAMCTITITGSNFEPGATVQIDGVNATNVNVVNSKTITAIVPTSKKTDQYVNIMVTNAGGLSSTRSNGFFYGHVLFQDNFSDGNFSNWNGALTNTLGAGFCVADTSGTCLPGTIHVGSAVSGTFTSCPNAPATPNGSAYDVCQTYQRNSAGSGDSDVYMNENFSTGLQHYFARWYTYVQRPNQTLPLAAGPVERKLLYVNPPGYAGSGAFLDITMFNGSPTNAGGMNALAFPVGQGGSTTANECYGASSLNFNTWYEVEHEVQTNTTSPSPVANGYGNVWLNGSFSCSYSNAWVNGTSTTGAKVFDFGQQISGGFGSGGTYPYKEYRFVADVVIANAYVP